MICRHLSRATIYFLVISGLTFTYGCRRKPEKTTDNNKTIANTSIIKPIKTKVTKTKRNNYPPSRQKHSQTASYKRQPPQPHLKPTNLNTTSSELLAILKNIESIEDNSKKYLAFKELGKEIGRENFKNALALAHTVSNESARRQIYKGIFEAQTEIDPMGALKVAASLSTKTISEDDYTTSLLIAIRGAAAVDPHTSLSYLADIKSQRTKMRARTALYTGWGKLDQNAALESAAALSEKDQRMIVPAIFNGWAQRDVFAAINYAEKLGNVAIKNMIIYNIANGYLENKWDENTFANAIETEVSQMPPIIQALVLPEMYKRWATTSPADAAEHYINNHNGPLTVRDSILNIIIREWANLKPSEALKWAEDTIDNDDDYVAIVRTITSSLRYKNPQKVAALLEELPFTFADDTTGSIEVYKLMKSWVRKNPQAAINWTESLNNRQLKIIATKSIAANMVLKDYNKTMEWAENIQDSDIQAYAFSNIALKQSLKKLNHSDKWIESLPSGFVKTRTAAGYALGALWRSRDQAAAAQFKQQLTDDELNPAELITILENSNLNNTTKARMIELLRQ